VVDPTTLVRVLPVADAHVKPPFLRPGTWARTVVGAKQSPAAATDAQDTAFSLASILSPPLLFGLTPRGVTASTLREGMNTGNTDSATFTKIDPGSVLST